MTGYLRTNNFNKVSENFLNSLMNDHPIKSDPTSLGALAGRSHDTNMGQLRALMEKSHQNPARTRKSVPKRDRKDWDLGKMAINSTGSNFEVQLNEHIARAAKERRPLNEIVRGGGEQQQTISHERTANELNQDALQGLNAGGDAK